MDAADRRIVATAASPAGAGAGAGAAAVADAGAAFAVVVMAKAPVAGLAKTRLISLLGPAGAARAQRGFALRTLATAHRAQPERLTFSCAPNQDERFFRALRRSARWPNLHFTDQVQGDIGQRMAAVFAAQADRLATPVRTDRPTLRPALNPPVQQPRSRPFAPPDHPPPPRPAPEPLLLIGTDCPVLTIGYLQAAAYALQQGADAVFGPVEDGGYLLVGLRDPSAAERLQIFERIDWSTERVMAQSRERLRAAQAAWHELPLLWDVDEPADWLRWQRVRPPVQRPDDERC